MLADFLKFAFHMTETRQGDEGKTEIQVLAPKAWRFYRIQTMCAVSVADGPAADCVRKRNVSLRGVVP